MRNLEKIFSRDSIKKKTPEKISEIAPKEVFGRAMEEKSEGIPDEIQQNLRDKSWRNSEINFGKKSQVYVSKKKPCWKNLRTRFTVSSGKTSKRFWRKSEKKKTLAYIIGGTLRDNLSGPVGRKFTENVHWKTLGVPKKNSDRSFRRNNRTYHRKPLNEMSGRASNPQGILLEILPGSFQYSHMNYDQV